MGTMRPTVHCSQSLPLTHGTAAPFSQHTVAATADEVVTWGGNSDGQTGQGDRAEATWCKPRSIRALQGAMVTQVVCGGRHTLCVTATSQVGVSKVRCQSWWAGNYSNRRSQQCTLYAVMQVCCLHPEHTRVPCNHKAK